MRPALFSRSTRTGPSLTMLIPLLLVLFTSTASAASAVLGIDLGTNFIKAAIVKPGTPLDIVLTKDSKRKEASVVAFKPDVKKAIEVGQFPERLYGSDALALGGRFPGDVYTHLKALLGLTPSDASVVDDYKTAHPAIKVQSAESKGTTLIKSGAFSDKEQPWSVEELLSMELKNIRANAEAMAGKGSRITEAVITIPSFYTSEERRAVERAASLAGIDLMGLISDGLAVGIDYSVKREFPNVSKGGKPEHHLIFDMGAGSTTATILRFQGKDVKDIGRYNKTIQEVAVVGAGWDRTLGGNTMNGLLVNHIVDEFVKGSQASAAGISASDVKNHGRTSSKLWREAERARQVLSANSDVRSSFEGLYQDIDFKTVVSRAQFEEMTAEFADRVEKPVRQALEAAKLTVADLDSIIMHGGMTRTPFVQKRLEAIAGKSTEVRSNVNADESAAFGAAFKAAGLSPSFKVKEIRDADAAIYAAGISHQSDSKQRQQKVFLPTSTMGTAKQLSFKDKEDFVFQLYQNVDDADRPIAEITTRNLTASVASLIINYGCSKDDISTKFNLRLNPVNDIPEVLSGSVSCEVEGSAKTGGIGDSVKGLFGFGSKKGDQEALKEDDAATTTDQVTAGSSSSISGSPSAFSASAEKDTKPKKRTEMINIDFAVTPQGLPLPTAEQTVRMRERLAAFDRSDKARVQREEALNVLEGFTYRARDLLTDAGFEAASTEDARAKLSSLLSSTSEWLYGEGSTATTEVLKSKLADLKTLVDPVQLRQQEALKRPEILNGLETAINTTKQMVAGVADQIKKMEEAAKAAEEAATKSATDDTDALDDDAASTTSKPAFEHPKMFAPYTWEDWDELKAKFDTINEWYEENVPSLKSLTAYEDPKVLVKDIESKTNELNSYVNRLMNKKFEQAKQQKPSSRKTKSTKGKKTSSTSSSATSSKSRDIPEFTPEPEAPLSPEDEEYIMNMIRDQEAKDKAEGKTHDEL